MRMTDLVLTIPGFPLLLVLSTVWDFGSPCAMGLVLGIFGWGGLARAVRAQTLVLAQHGFLEAARGLGLPGRRIILHEIVPNVAPYIAMNLLLSVTGAIYAEAGCSSWAWCRSAPTTGGSCSTSRCSPRAR